MKLLAKRILFVIAQGVSYGHYSSLRRGLEREGAEIFVTTPHPFLSVEAKDNEGRYHNILVDFPIELSDVTVVDALVVPGGQRCVEFVTSDRLGSRLLKDMEYEDKPVLIMGEQLVKQENIRNTFLFECIQEISSNTSTHDSDEELSGSMEKIGLF